MPITITYIHCLPVNRTLSFLLEAKMATPRKKGNEKIILIVSSVNASTEVSANAFLTRIALVENNIAPNKVIRNPASEILKVFVVEFINSVVNRHLHAFKI